MPTPRRNPEPALHPVRWPRPSGLSLLRLSLTVALLTAAAALAWLALDPCGVTIDPPPPGIRS